MVFALILSISLFSKLIEAVSVSMIPESGTPPPIRDLPGFALNEEANKLYIYGGRNVSPLDDMWEFDLATETWREIHYTSSIYPGPRSEPYLVSLKSGEILLFGGNTKSGPVSDLWVFDIENKYVRYIQWNLVSSNGTPPPRSYYRAMCHYKEDGKKYLAVYGGVGEREYIQNLFM
jgi:hypothetical protein